MLLDLMSLVLALFTLVLGAGTFYFCLQCFAGLHPGSTQKLPLSRSISLAVLVPAHNEELSLSHSLTSIRSQLRASDRLVVVADNCSDGTETIARNQGAEVVVRTDPLHRGKGYALDAGLRYLSRNPPQVVIMLDADCTIGPDCLAHLDDLVCRQSKPAQACYLMKARTAEAPHLAINEFAFLIKNCIRLRGLSRFHLPCHLTGSGMAFPWQALRQVDLSSDHLAEDMKLGLDLAQLGQGAIYCNNAHVLSDFPTSLKGQTTQRHRWEKGRANLALSSMRTLCSPRSYRHIGAPLLALDSLIPPLTALALLLSVHVSALIIMQVFIQQDWLLRTATAIFLLFLLTIACVWATCGRSILPVRYWPAMMRYLTSRVGLYRALAVRANPQWIRSERGVGDI